MKVFVAGATGAIGTPLTRLLIAHGHEVLGLARNADSAAALRALGAQPIVGDALQRSALLDAVKGHTADAVIHELTSLKKPPLRASGLVGTNRLRTAGTANLIAAAERLGARRMVTQSIIFGYGYCDHGDGEVTENHSFGVSTGQATDAILAALHSAEEQTFRMPEGIALRYGAFYGGDAKQMQAMLKARKIPVAFGGLLGWIHHHDAAAATVAALEAGRPGQAYNIVDDQPATWLEVFDAMAAGLGAPPPRRFPRTLLRILAPNLTAFAFDTNIRVSNAKAKKELGWSPRFTSFREGIQAMVAATRPERAPMQQVEAVHRSS